MNKTVLAASLALTFAAAPAFAQERPASTLQHQNHQTTQQHVPMQQTQAERTRTAAEANANATQTDMRPDAWLLTKVKAQFATSDIVDATDINIDVKDGVAWLKGNVGSAAEQREAIRLAQTTEGVKSVNSSGLKLVAETGANPDRMKNKP